MATPPSDLFKDMGITDRHYLDPLKAFNPNISMKVNRETFRQEYNGNYQNDVSSYTGNIIQHSKRMLVDICYRAFMDGKKSAENNDYSSGEAFQQTELYYNIMHNNYSPSQKLRKLLLQTTKLQEK